MKETKKKRISLPTKKQIETELKRYRRQKAYNKALADTIYVLTMVAAIAVLIATLVLPVVQIEGTSMEPTLVNGDIVLLTKTTNFERGELCGFSWNNKLLIKRVIAVEGDTVEISSETGAVLLNGQVLSETYTSGLTSREGLLAPITVPKGQVFLLGDNRAAGQSLDSRSFGGVSVDSIIGTAVYRFAPWEKRGGF